MINGNLTDSMNINAQYKRVYEHFLRQYNTKTALNPKGSLVHRNPIESVAAAVKNTGKDIVNLGNALKDGNADDHSLGRLNDVGMKLGGLGIAAYLATRKTSPRAKAMEFIGAAVFFSMMQLWQKIFIATPLKARFGVDINQKFIDSAGREKELNLDNQYTPQLRSDEELDELADKLKLPKDMEYRREYAQEKARRIALQGRTLNMLTAGVGVPVMTALVCSKIEEYIDNTVINSGLNKAWTTIGAGLDPVDAVEHFSNVVNSRARSAGFGAEAEKIIKSYADYTGSADDEFFNGLAKAFNPVGFVESNKLTKEMPDITPKVAADLKRMFHATIDEDSLSSSVIDLFMKKSTENNGVLSMKVLDPDGVAGAVTDINIDKSRLEIAIKNVIARVKNGEVEYEDTSILDALKGEEGLLVQVKNTISGLDDSVIENLKDIRTQQLLNEGKTMDEIADIFKNGDSILEDMIKSEEALFGGVTSTRNIAAVPSDIASDSNSLKTVIDQAKKRQMPAFLEKVKANFNLAKKTGAVVSTAEDAIKAIDNSSGKEYFNITDVLFNMMKPDKATLERLRSDSGFASTYIQNAFAEISKDDAKYAQIVENIKNTPVADDSAIDIMVSRIIDNCREKLDVIRHGDGLNGATGFDPNMKTMIELTDRASSSNSGLLGVIEKYTGEVIPGIDATKNRLLLALDLERRINDGTLKQQWDALQTNAPVTETFEDFVSNCRNILYNNTPNDFSNTHYIKQNGKYFARLNDILFNKPMSQTTVDILDTVKENAQNADNNVKSLVQKLNEMRISLMAIGSNGAVDYANRKNQLDVNMILDDHLKQVFNDIAGGTCSLKFQKVGKSIKDLVFENASQKFNSKTWMKIFAPLAIALVGVTFLAQLFIGRDKDIHLYTDKKTNSNPGAVNGNK